MIILSLYLPAKTAIIDAYLKTKPTTADLAEDWINKNLPEGSKILKDRFSPRVDKTHFRVKQDLRITPKRFKNKVFLVGYDYVVRSEYSNVEYPFYKDFLMLRKFKAEPGKRPGFDLIIYQIPPDYKERLLFNIDLFKEGKVKKALIDIGGQDELFIDKGWNEKESDNIMNWRWSEGNFSTILFPLNNPQNMEIEVALRPYISADRKEQEINILINDNFLAKEKIPRLREFRLLSFPINRGVLKKGVNCLRFQYSNVTDLTNISEGKDRRKVALAFDYVRLRLVD